MISGRTILNYSATFPAVPVVALTATASKKDVINIKRSLNMRNPVEVIASPNRPNIFYEKVFRKGEDIEVFEAILHPITILYLPPRWCGFAYKFFGRVEEKNSTIL